LAEREFKTSPIYVLPILASLCVSISCALLIINSGVSLASVTPLPETGYGPILNAMIFVLAAGMSATLIYLLMKHGVQVLIRVLLAVAFSVLTFATVLFYAELALITAQVEISAWPVLVLASGATFFVMLEVFLRKGIFYSSIILIFGGSVGSLLGASIPVYSAVFILLLLAVYDIVAVFRGPIGKLAARGLEQLPGTSLSFKTVSIGLGDLTFYSMLISRFFISYGWKACAAASIGVLFGSYISLKMLERKGMFPGLPFSVLLGLLSGYLGSLWN
jgi:presenilin-like A22 family membrane protease